MKRTETLSANMEDYLEAIVSLQQKNKIVRVRDIGHRLHVKNSSVTAALQTLSRANLVIHERYGYVALTSRGRRLAGNIQKRHNVLMTFLTDILHIDPAIAAVDACKLEHAMSMATQKNLAAFIECINSCPVADRPAWNRRFHSYLKNGRFPQRKRTASRSKGR